MKEIGKVFFVLLVIWGSFMMWVRLDRKPAQEEAALPQKVEEEKQEVPEQEVTIHRQDGDVVLPLEEYLIGVVSSEMPVSFELEALKAQSVAARTFVVKRNFEVDDTTSSQVYKSNEELKAVWKEGYDENLQKVKEAVHMTKGEVLTYQGEYITAAFFSTSAGKTANAHEYWTNETPYLKSVDSPWDLEVNDNSIQQITMTKQRMQQLLNLADPITEIKEPTRYDSGYVKEIIINGVSFSGRTIREKLSLRSSCFAIAIQGENVVITMTGFGHGIGMSQYGAQGMALKGYTYDQILKHYYTGVEISNLRV